MHWCGVVSVLLALLCLALAQDENVRGWNKAMGLWGKRSAPMDPETFYEKRSQDTRSWGKLNNMWGKRSAATADWEKRGTWQMANGLWGRRK